MLAGCFRTPSQASQLPQLDRVCPWNAVECGSWLACDGVRKHPASIDPWLHPAYPRACHDSFVMRFDGLANS